MTTTASIAVRFRARASPRAIVGVVGEGASASSLVRRLLEMDEERRRRMRGVAAPGIVALLGAVDDLPWVDGAIWLGTDPAAPGLLLPTSSEPDVPVDLLARRVRLLAPKEAWPVALLPRSRRVVPLASAREISAAALADLAPLVAPLAEVT